MQGGNSCYFVTCIWKMWERLSLAGSAYCCWFSREPGGLANPRCPHVGQLNAVETNTRVKKTPPQNQQEKTSFGKAARGKPAFSTAGSKGTAQLNLVFQGCHSWPPTYIHTKTLKIATCQTTDAQTKHIWTLGSLRPPLKTQGMLLISMYTQIASNQSL